MVSFFFFILCVDLNTTNESVVSDSFDVAIKDGKTGKVTQLSEQEGGQETESGFADDEGEDTVESQKEKETAEPLKDRNSVKRSSRRTKRDERTSVEQVFDSKLCWSVALFFLQFKGLGEQYD